MPHDPLRLGAYEVTPLCDGWAPLPLAAEIPEVDVDWDAERARFPWAFPEGDRTSWSWHVHAFLVRHAETVVLVDTGIGHFGRPPFDVAGRVDAELEAAGVAAGDVDHVVLTHLHADHAGAACTPGGEPRFPNARYHVHADDWTFFGERRTPDDFTGRFAMAPLEAAGVLDLDPADHEVAPGVSLLHAPGHTPGHRVVRLHDGPDTLLLTGDLLHVPPQIRHPSSPSDHDEDPELGATERVQLIGRAAAERWLVGVSHFGRPFGRVTPQGWAPL